MRPNKLIQFYLTNMCNSRCKTCSIWTTTNKDKLELSLNKVINTIKLYPKADFVFGGGEFTMYSKARELLKFCTSNNINYTILSNCIDVDVLEQLLASFDVKNLTISCDGVKHDKIRGIAGNLKKIKDVVGIWKGYVPNLKISYTLSKYNEECLDEDMRMFKEMGVNKIYFCLAQSMDLLSTRGSVTPSITSIEKMYYDYGDMLYDKDKQFLRDVVLDNVGKCDSIENVHTIYTNGDVVTCQSFMSRDVVGNIYNNSLKEILDKRELKDFKCEYSEVCELVCQRRYDYEDRL